MLGPFITCSFGVSYNVQLRSFKFAHSLRTCLVLSARLSAQNLLLRPSLLIFGCDGNPHD